jgi:hypothetical protein
MWLPNYTTSGCQLNFTLPAISISCLISIITSACKVRKAHDLTSQWLKIIYIYIYIYILVSVGKLYFELLDWALKMDWYCRGDGSG